jgi:hypothetical protein
VGSLTAKNKPVDLSFVPTEITFVSSSMNIGVFELTIKPSFGCIFFFNSKYISWALRFTEVYHFWDSTLILCEGLFWKCLHWGLALKLKSKVLQLVVTLFVFAIMQFKYHIWCLCTATSVSQDLSASIHGQLLLLLHLPLQCVPWILLLPNLV